MLQQQSRRGRTHPAETGVEGEIEGENVAATEEKRKIGAETRRKLLIEIGIAIGTGRDAEARRESEDEAETETEGGKIEKRTRSRRRTSEWMMQMRRQTRPRSKTRRMRRLQPRRVGAIRPRKHNRLLQKHLQSHQCLHQQLGRRRGGHHLDRLQHTQHTICRGHRSRVGAHKPSNQYQPLLLGVHLRLLSRPRTSLFCQACTHTHSKRQHQRCPPRHLRLRAIRLKLQKMAEPRTQGVCSLRLKM
mmetsp:Transcript_3301/g.8217  ORF Transcript_3301/g.8217 Transcript_3301/m.8217 type:complete len:246 (-) Transcript_3301:1218-1955(-)